MARTATISTPDDTGTAGLDYPEPTNGPTPAAVGSPLFNLRRGRERRQAQLFTELAVPRWADELDGEPGTRLTVRYRPISQARTEQLAKATEKSKDPEKTLRLNANLLAEACLGVFVWVTGEDGQDVRVGADPEAEDPTNAEHWPRFDDALAASLGIGAGLPAAEVVRAVFFTDGDLMSTANRLTTWSGYALGGDELEAEGRG